MMKLVECTMCGLHKTRKNVVVGDGNYAKSRVMLIGEAPGKNEDELGVPFVGKAGKILNKMLLDMGLNKNRVYITNLVKCRPPSNRNPLPYEIDKCKKWLWMEIKKVKPELIITLGLIPAKTLLKFKNITTRTGVLYHHPKLDCRIYPMLHPASVIYNPDRKKIMYESIKMFKSFSTTDGIIKNLNKYKVHIYRDGKWVVK